MTFHPVAFLPAPTLLTTPIESLLSDRSPSFSTPRRGVEVHLRITPNYVPYTHTHTHAHTHTLVSLLYFPFHPRAYTTHIHRNTGHKNSMDRTPTKLFKTIIPRDTAGCDGYTCVKHTHTHAHTEEILG